MVRLRSYLLLTLVFGVVAAWATAVETGRVLDTWGHVFDAETNGGNTITADTFGSPTGLGATAASATQINLSWTASNDAYATGYQVFRRLFAGAYPGLPTYTLTETQTSCITPGDSICAYSDVAGLSGGTQYCYKVRATYLNWTSGASTEACATTPSACSTNTGFLNPASQGADTGGDGDGFEGSPTNAFADGGGSASNINGPGDRHRYFTYGVAVPDGCVVKGIEVRVDWFLGENPQQDNSISVELSWNAGTSWTTGKTDAVESTVERTVILGSATDLWGPASWSSTQVNNTNFRVRISALCVGPGASCGGNDWFLDWIPVRVTFGTP